MPPEFSHGNTQSLWIRGCIIIFAHCLCPVPGTILIFQYPRDLGNTENLQHLLTVILGQINIYIYYSQFISRAAVGRAMRICLYVMTIVIWGQIGYWARGEARRRICFHMVLLSQKEVSQFRINNGSHGQPAGSASQNYCSFCWVHRSESPH